MNSSGMLFCTSGYALEINGERVWVCVCARSLYVRICPCQCLLLSLPRCEYLFVYICMHGVRQPTIQTSRQQLSTFIPIIFDFMKWKEQWTNGIHTYARTSHTLWEMQNKRANYKNRMRHQLSANGYNSWRRERERESNIQLRYKHTHSHTLTCSHLFILFDSYCFFVGYQNKMEKKNSKRTRTITKKNENEKGKQNDTMLFDYYLANWNNKAQNEHQMHKHTGVQTAIQPKIQYVLDCVFIAWKSD